MKVLPKVRQTLVIGYNHHAAEIVKTITTAGLHDFSIYAMLEYGI